MDARGYSSSDKQDVKEWYDGFNFGHTRDIYNPWSVTYYMKMGQLRAWWANTSSNSLIGKTLQQGNAGIKIQMEKLLQGEILTLPIDEEIVFNQLDDNPEAVWSLMLASGYLKVVYEDVSGAPLKESGFLCNLMVTNKETRDMMEGMVIGWFKKNGGSLPHFLSGMFRGDCDMMEDYLNQLLRNTISYFDPGRSEDAPESFYHGLVLGLIVNTAKDYHVRSNRESGFGRYDVMMEPKDPTKPAVILEFKVFDDRREKTLEDTAARALKQIEEMMYDTELLARGIPAENILKYAIAFQGKECIVRETHGSIL